MTLCLHLHATVFFLTKRKDPVRTERALEKSNLYANQGNDFATTAMFYLHNSNFNSHHLILACFLPSVSTSPLVPLGRVASCSSLLLSCGLSTDGVVVSHDELQSPQKGLHTGPCQRVGLNDFAVHDTIGLDNEQAWLSKQGRLL